MDTIRATKTDAVVYLSGPMTGLPEFNYPAFNALASTLRGSGFVVNNPAVMTQFEGNTFQADVTAIDLSYEFKGTAADAFGRPMTGSDGGDAGGLTPVPAMSWLRLRPMRHTIIAAPSQPVTPRRARCR